MSYVHLPMEEIERKMRLGLIPHPNRQNLGRVRCYSKKLKDALIHESMSLSSASGTNTSTGISSSLGRSSRSMHNSSSNSQSSPSGHKASTNFHGLDLDPEYVEKRKIHHMKKFYEAQQKRRLQDERKAKEIIQKRAQLAEEKFHQMMVNVMEAKKEVDEIEQYLVIKDEKDATKRFNLWKAWQERVFDPIQSRLRQNLKPECIEDLHEKRYDLYLEYLRASKKGAGLFADIINEHEYDPLRWKEFDVGIKTKDISDPVQRDLQKIQEESRMINANTAVSEQTLQGSKPGPGQNEIKRLDVKQWGAVKIMASPYAPFKDRNKDKPMSLTHQSSIPFDHFNISKDQDVVQKEFFPPSKKIDISRRAITMKSLA